MKNVNEKLIIILSLVILTSFNLVNQESLIKFLEVVFLIPSFFLFYFLFSNKESKQEDLKIINSFIK